MNKKVILLLATIIISICTFAQSISPNEITEFCPNKDYVFTVTLPRIAAGTTPKVSSWTNNPIVVSDASNLTHTSTQTTFTFVGRFKDVNINQVFKVDYTPSGGAATYYLFQFKKVKSLYYGACTDIQPNRSSITADWCQIQSFSISFNNLQWKTQFESPSFCFGSITTYEYLLPNGWKLGTTTSNGPTWIQAGNSVTVTSNATTGNNQAVQIRAINTGCGAGLVAGPVVSIPISRPAPPLSITGSATMCYPNSYTYTLNGVPAGSTISWGNTNSYYSLTASGNTATVKPTAAANGSTAINATVTLSCGISFPVSTSVSIGAPSATFNIVSYPYAEPSCYEIWGIYTFQAQQATGYPNTYTGFQWGWRNLTNGTTSSDPTIYGSQYTFIPEETGNYQIWVRATNQCGVSAYESVKAVTVNNICSGMSMQQNTLNAYPNPAKSKVTVQAPTSFRKNAVLQLINQSGLVVLTQKINGSGETVDIDLSRLKEGLYQMILKAGNEVRHTRVFKQQ